MHIKYRGKSFILQETKDPNLFDKNRTQKNVKCHIQHEDSRLRWIVIELVNYKIVFPAERIVLANFQSLFRRSDPDAFWENEGKIHERRCVKEFFFVNL